MALTNEMLETTPEEGIDPQNPGEYKTLLEDLQGNILRGHGRDHSVHLFVQFKPDQTVAAKQWIHNFARTHVTSAQQQSDEGQRYRDEGAKGTVFSNFFLSRTGYEYLGFERWQIPGDQSFRAGMKDPEVRAKLLDPEVEKWDPGFQADIHALVLMADDDVVDLLQEVNRVTQKLRQVAEIVHREDGFILRNEDRQIIEHFGFVDGLSQPLFLRRDIRRARDESDFSKWDPRAPLSLVLAKDDNGQTEDSYGSYFVYRKLEQNVALWRDDERKLAEKLGISREFAGALAMGRFPDGTPVTLSDRAMRRGAPINNFNFKDSDDTDGSRCPFHAHIRKTNPRGDTGQVQSAPSEAEALGVERRHRITRRGISYGENDPSQEPASGSGLLFLCCQADIGGQFEFIQSAWANQPNFVQVGVGLDPAIGQPFLTDEKKGQQWPKKWGEADRERFLFKLWAFLKGGGYFFAPSISCLQSLRTKLADSISEFSGEQGKDH